MAVKLRLRRVGSKKQAIYRIVAADSRAPRDGRYIEIIGTYNPLTDPSTVTFKAENALYWLNNGAAPTDIVKKLLVDEGIWETFSGEKAPEKQESAVKVSKKTVAKAAAEVKAAEEAAAAAAAAKEEAAKAAEAPAEEPVAEVVVEEAPAVEVVEEAPVVEEVAAEEPATEEAPAEAPAEEEEEAPAAE